MEKEHILIIEDDADIREGIRILLESENYTVSEAGDGKSGLETMSKDIDLVILDVMMPGMSGIQVCKAFPMYRYCFLQPKSRKQTSLPVLWQAVTIILRNHFPMENFWEESGH